MPQLNTIRESDKQHSVEVHLLFTLHSFRHPAGGFGGGGTGGHHA